MSSFSPFHETIVTGIQNASSIELVLIANLLTSTVIPKNHDNIIAAWKLRIRVKHFDDCGVVASLEVQKRTHANSRTDVGGI